MGNEPRPKIPRDLFIIDEAVRDEYYYIGTADTCFYIWERMSRLWRDHERPDYSQYPVNGLISNLQIPASYRISEPKRHYWKEKAIHYAAGALGSLMPDYLSGAGVTFVPIPPSKPTSDPEYDNRMMEILRAIRPKLPDVRPLVYLSTEGFDSKQKGVRPADRAAHYSIDETHADPVPDVVILFDDVLTTGCHFKAIEIVLNERFPGITVAGLFLARTVRPTDDSADLFASLLG
ncbi:MAG: hypothetical protein ABI759_07005 [Candidatus Solibacter sp.]